MVLVLAGCAPVGVTPTAEPMPTETPEPSAMPEPTLPLECDDVFSDAEASDVLQFPVTLKLTPADINTEYDIATAQVGMFSCTWGGDNTTDNSWDQTIDLAILAEAEAEFDTGVWQVNDGATVYPDGSTASEYRCSLTDERHSMCVANLLVDGYWAQAIVNSIGSNDGRTSGTAEASMRAVVDAVTNAIETAGEARPSWTVPAEALGGEYCGAPQQLDPGLAQFVETVALYRSGYYTCGWNERAAVSIVPGGAWAFDGFGVAPPVVSYDVPPLEPVTVDGADAAFAACSYYCYAMLSVGGSSFTINMADSTLEPFLAQLPAIVSAVADAG